MRRYRYLRVSCCAMINLLAAVAVVASISGNTPNYVESAMTTSPVIVLDEDGMAAAGNSCTAIVVTIDVIIQLALDWIPRV